MGDVNNMWVNLPKYSPEYSNGVKSFVKNASANFGVGDELRCPCKKCNNHKWHVHNVVYDHLICHGPSSTYLQWICDVSYPNLKGSTYNMGYETNSGIVGDLDELLHSAHQDTDTKKFYLLVEDRKQPLYPGCKNFSRLSFVVRLYLLKCNHGITKSAFGDILKLLKEAFPDINVPSFFNDAKNIIEDLGLDYQKLHACPNDCMLYWRENETEQQCKICGTSRWRSFKKDESNGIDNEEATNSAHKVPAKVMRYFPLKLRLQQMFMCKEFSKLMTWHSSDRKNDGKLRHPADGQAWKSMDVNYPLLSSESRNARLGLASDGFNPFGTMSISQSTWPIILVNYNIPPYLGMKSENLILSTLISGPKSPGNNIDVYMKPLIAELKDLWDMGIETYDALNKQTFQLHATLLWTISYFPGYAILSGWSTKGKLACPVCNYETSSTYLKHSKKMCYMNYGKFLNEIHKWRADKKRFNGDVEEGTTPVMLSGTEIEELLHGYENQYGKKMKQ